jgi:hypothetical protein
MVEKRKKEGRKEGRERRKEKERKLRLLLFR